MLTTVEMIVLGVVGLAIVIVIIVIASNTNKSTIKKDIDDLIVRYNTIKTVPLAFKFNKAQAMAKRNDDTGEKVQSYYNRYVEAQKHIDEVGEMLEDVEDDLASHNEKHAKETIVLLNTLVEDCEKEVASIDEFLDQFSKKESEQRNVSAGLKEDYREIKMFINENSNYFSIAYEGIEKKMEKIEELFSQSEEWIYANDYPKAADAFDEIEERIVDLKKSYKIIPDLVKDAKGIIPVLIDEVNRQYSLCRQRGIYLEHLNIDERLDNAQTILNAATKTLVDANYDGVKEKLDSVKNELDSLLKGIQNDNQDYIDSKSIIDNITSNIKSIKEVHAYIEASYTNDNERFDMNEVKDYLKVAKDSVDNYAADLIKLNEDLDSKTRSASEIKEEATTIFNSSETILEKLVDYKHAIDKNTNDEERAKTQLVKLQVVMNEVEVKVLEYHLPTIASSYQKDLVAGRERIATIKKLLEEVPLNIDNLNKTLDEAIDFIYTFYNNVNNIVGMAIMVENAIVFGNKYRSTYPAVDRDLSKAEFSYLNGEYTKALTMAISCMETLFPNNANEKILENN